ncbi:3'-5' exonuclease [Alicyclobacillus shizuokensis]|uniref:3'-5' exonuclease n=1 Tax=Alicyclobacillus shizuokensis TaxID=392014 RepID=UPI0012ED82FD|nr:3'-5' exonuclease [Alicyclobacillus shizuokensis]MCL6627638.1 exonuclease domain-containing protein [Alicyclobacillus shizuokensis]
MRTRTIRGEGAVIQLIIHDVEAIVRRGHMYNAEIIEIAALRAVPDEDGKWKDAGHFHAYVRPQDVTSIPVVTTRFTGITEADMAGAKRFPEVLQSFLEWIGEDEYYLCSWSLSDRDYFIADCRRHGLSLDWIRNYNDIQKWFGRKLHLSQRSSLQNALELLQLAPEGQAHNALADTVNTFRVFNAIYNHDDPVFRLEQNDCSGRLKTEVVYEEEFRNNPFTKLQGLFE